MNVSGNRNDKTIQSSLDKIEFKSDGAAVNSKSKPSKHNLAGRNYSLSSSSSGFVANKGTKGSGNAFADTDKKEDETVASDDKYRRRGFNFVPLKNGVYEDLTKNVEEFDVAAPPQNSQKFPFDLSSMEPNKIYGLFFNIYKHSEKSPTVKNDVIFIILNIFRSEIYNCLRYTSKNSYNFWLEKDSTGTPGGIMPDVHYDGKVHVVVHLNPKSTYQMVCPSGFHFKYTIDEMNKERSESLKEIYSFSSILPARDPIPLTKALKFPTVFTTGESIPISVIESRLGYKFRNQGLLIQALTHSSKKNTDSRIIDNTQFIFYGKDVLHVLINEYITTHFTLSGISSLKNREVSKLSNDLLKIDFLEDLKLDVYIRVHQGTILTPLIFAEALKAILAAALLDGGITAARSVFAKFLEKSMPVFLASAKSSCLEIQYQENALECLYTCAEELHKLAGKDLEPKEKNLAEIRKTFNRKSLLTFALTHPSYIDEKKLKYLVPKISSLGAPLVSLILLKFIIGRFPTLTKDELAKKIHGYSIRNFSKNYLEQLNLQDSFLIADSYKPTDGDLEDLDTFFYIQMLTIIYLDKGFDSAEAFFLKTFNLEKDIRPASENVVSNRQKRAQKKAQSINKADLEEPKELKSDLE